MPVGSGIVAAVMDAGSPLVTSHPVSVGVGDPSALLSHLGLVGGPAEQVSCRLLDTFDARLAAAGLTAVATERHARRSDRVWFVVAGERDGVAAVTLDAVPSCTSGLPAGPLRARLAELLDVRVLLTVVTVSATMQVWRQTDADGRTIVEVTCWSGVAVAPGEHAIPADPARPICRATTPLEPAVWLEVRTVRGEGAADRVRAALSAAGLATLRVGVPVALAELAGVDRTGRGSRLSAELDRSMHAIDGYREVLRDLLGVIDANRAGAAAAIDPEFLHDLRVAVRRTRSVLRHARRVLPDDVRDRARHGFGRLGQLTGHARDLDVQVLDWSAMTAGFDGPTRHALEPVLAHFTALREAAHEHVRAGLADPATDELLEWWRSWLGGQVDEPAGRDADRRLAPVVARRLRRAQTRLLGDARAIDDRSPAEHLHQLRKDAKALRYLFECFAPILPERPRKRFVRRLKSFQDLLGTHQDAEVHAHLLTGVATDLAARGAGVDTLLAIGRLVEVHDARRIAMRARFAEEFAVYDADATHEAFTAVLRELRS